jgi:hypothetical protein
MILFYAHWKIGDTLDFMLSERRDEDAATAFFKQAINNNGFPDKVVRFPDFQGQLRVRTPADPLYPQE